MLRRKLRFYCVEGEGEGGGSNGATTFTQAQVDEMVKGLKANNAALLKEKKTALDTLQQFDGIDPVQAREVLTMFQSNEDLKLIKEGKVDVVFEKKTEKMRADHKKALDDREREVAAAKSRAEKFSKRVLNDALRAAAMEAGVHKHAMEDVLLNGGIVFQLDEDGNAVQMAEGQVVLGKDGKTPYGPKEWLAAITDQKPHWFPASSSGAPAGGQPAQGGGRQKTMKRSVFDTLSPYEKAETMKTTRVID